MRASSFSTLALLLAGLLSCRTLPSVPDALPTPGRVEEFLEGRDLRWDPLTHPLRKEIWSIHRIIRSAADSGARPEEDRWMSVAFHQERSIGTAGYLIRVSMEVLAGAPSFAGPLGELRFDLRGTWMTTSLPEPSHPSVSGPSRVPPTRPLPAGATDSSHTRSLHRYLDQALLPLPHRRTQVGQTRCESTLVDASGHPLSPTSELRAWRADTCTTFTWQGELLCRALQRVPHPEDAQRFLAGLYSEAPAHRGRIPDAETLADIDLGQRGHACVDPKTFDLMSASYTTRTPIISEGRVMLVTEEADLESSVEVGESFR